jgi:MFS family permease
MSEKSIKFTYIKLPKSVYAILFARIVNAMGNFVFPFMTLLLTTKIGMTEQQAGSFLLMGSMLQIPGALIGGKLCDITGRKKIMIIFMGLAALCYIPCAVLTECPDSFFYLPWLMIISIFFNSIARPASGAMVNDLTYPENRQAAFSLLYMGMNVGAAIGSLLAGFLFQKYMKLLFLGDMVTTIIAVLIMMIFVKETKPSKEEWVIVEQSECNDEKAETGGMLAALLHRPRLLIFALFDTIFSFIYAQTSFSLPLQVNAIFGETQGARYYGTFNMINCMEVIFFTTIITIVTKKVKTLYNVSMAGLR